MTASADKSSRISLSHIKIIHTGFKAIRNEQGVMEEFPKEEIISYRVPTVSTRRRFVYYYIDILLVAIPAFCFANFVNYGNQGLFLFFFLVIYLTYYIVSEGLFSSTIGKFFLDVIVIDEYADPIGFKKSFSRAFCRFIPSIPTLFYRKHNRFVHDVWTDTYVINKKDLKHIKEKLNNTVDGIYRYNEF